MPKPMLLVILDGFGHTDHTDHNPLHHNSLPTFDHLWRDSTHTLLEASGEAVGLPEGQMGNSEVGHLHVGAGRKILQDLTRIDKAIKTGEFTHNAVLLDAIAQAKANNKAVHILGLLSQGGVHSHESHIMALIKMIADQGVQQNYLHALLDGRDTPPRSALESLQRVQDLYQQLPGGGIAHIIGRYYAMDRDRRWERTQQAYDSLTGQSPYQALTAISALEQAYARGETDEFVKPTAIVTADDQTVTIQDGDVVIFMNFRADRARQLTRAFIAADFTEFPRAKQPKIASFVSLAEYDKNFQIPVAFPTVDVRNTLGEFLAAHGKRQLRIAETEKYAHVTYFINGGNEVAYPGEDRILIPSPKIATYDLQPQMSAIELTDKLINAIENGQYDAIICNYANPDMIGHTGIMAAADQAVITMDHCMARVLEALAKVNGEAIITADHGNIETMFDEQTGQAHTAHTTNLVPFFYVGRRAKVIINNGALDDIAPTMLYLMGLQPPKEMTGRCLLQLEA